MSLPNLSGSNIQDTYQRVLHTDGTNIYDGTGSLFVPATASYAISASHEIVHELSSSYAETSSLALNAENADNAACSTRVTTITNTQNSTFYPTFVDSNHVDATCEPVYTSNLFQINPGEGLLQFNGKFKVKGSDVSIENGHISMSGAVTASNISSSGEMLATTGSFGHIITDGDTIEFRQAGTTNKLGAIKFDASNGLEVRNSDNSDRGNTRLGDTDLKRLNAVHVIVETNISSSGNISASGNIHGTQHYATAVQPHSGQTQLGFGTLSLSSQDYSLTIGHHTEPAPLTINSNITASGNISSSGDLIADRYFLQGTRLLSNSGTEIQINETTLPIYINGPSINLAAPVTASGEISASDKIIASAFTINTNAEGIQFMASNGNLFKNIATNTADDFLVQNLKNGENLRLRAGQSGNKGKVLIQQGGTSTNIASFGPTTQIEFTGNITASSAISASGNIYGAIVQTPRINGVGNSLYIADAIDAQSHITASGNISSSGVILADTYYVTNNVAMTDNGGVLQFDGGAAFSTIEFGRSNVTRPILVRGSITGSRVGGTVDISASGGGYFKNVTVDHYGVVSASNFSASAYVGSKNLGVTASYGRAGTQGWGGYINSPSTSSYSTPTIELISIPPAEFLLTGDGDIRSAQHTLYVRSSNPSALYQVASKTYYASYVVPGGYRVVGAQVFATGGDFKVFRSNVMDSVSVSLFSTGVETSTTTTQTVAGMSASLHVVPAYPPAAGEYVTIEWTPDSVANLLHGAVLGIQPC
jgi:hypothetical protein